MHQLKYLSPNRSKNNNTKATQEPTFQKMEVLGKTDHAGEWAKSRKG